MAESSTSGNSSARRLADLFTDIANAIREKTGVTAAINAINFPARIRGLPVLDTSDATAAAGDILSGKTAYVKGNKVTGNILSKAGETIIPGTSAKTAVAAGRYTTGAVTVQGDSNLAASNIRYGSSIFGVYGSVRPFVRDPYCGVWDLKMVTDVEGRVGNTSTGLIVQFTTSDSGYKPFFIHGSVNTVNNERFLFMAVKANSDGTFYITQHTSSSTEALRITTVDLGEGDTYSLPITTFNAASPYYEGEYWLEYYYAEE